MQRYFLSVLIAFSICTSAYGGIMNGNFETGGTDGWVAHIGIVSTPTDWYEAETKPAGTIQVGGDLNVWLIGGDEVTIPAINDSCSAIVGTSAGGWFKGDPEISDYNTYLQQFVHLDLGDTIGGKAMFLNGDDLAQDSGWVALYDSEMLLIETLWSRTSGGESVWGLNSVEMWGWTASTTGDYYLRLGVNSCGDDVLASYAIFDDIKVTSVPEPAACLLLLISTLLVAPFRLKMRS